MCVYKFLGQLLLFLFLEYKYASTLNDLDSCFSIICYSMFPRSTHETFAQKLYQTFKDHKRFSKPKLSRTDFTIFHYAGDVRYRSMGYLFLYKIRLMSNVFDGQNLIAGHVSN